VSGQNVLDELFLFFKLSHNRDRYRQSSVDCLCLQAVPWDLTGPMGHPVYNNSTRHAAAAAALRGGLMDKIGSFL
jgi:hypothetical protein